MRKVDMLLAARLTEYEERLAEHKELVLTLAQYEGRAINKRTNIKPFVLTEVDRVQGPKFEHFITNPVNLDKLDYRNAPNNQPDKIEQLKNLNMNDVVRVFGAIENKFHEMRGLFAGLEQLKLHYPDNPLYYEILREIGGEQKHIQLDQFYYIRKEKYDTVSIVSCVEENAQQSDTAE